MKRIYLVAGLILILGASLAIDWYTNTRFPAEEITVTSLPELEIGETRTYSYVREMDEVGTHSYTVTGKEGNYYTVVSSTDVTVEEKNLKLESVFIFDTSLTPSDYRLTVMQDDVINQINVSIIGNQIISKITYSNETATLEDDYIEGIVFTENNMPGLWELILRATEMKSGGRYKLDAYIPQGGTVFDLEFYVNPNTQNIYIGGEQLSCTVIQETTLDLRFFIYDGRLVQMRNDDQDLTFTLLD